MKQEMSRSAATLVRLAFFSLVCSLWKNGRKAESNLAAAVIFGITGKHLS